MRQVAINGRAQDKKAERTYVPFPNGPKTLEHSNPVPFEDPGSLWNISKIVLRPLEHCEPY